MNYEDYLLGLETPRHGSRLDEVAEDRGIDLEKLLDFSANMNPLGPPEDLGLLVRAATDRVGDYPDYRYRRFREAAVEFFSYEGIPGLAPDNIVPANGSVEVFRWVLRTVAENGGDKVLVPAPTFSEYSFQAEVAGLEPVRQSYSDVLELGRDELREFGAVFLANPNNPTGRLRKKGTLKKFVEKARDAGSYVVLDEAFIELADPTESLVGSAGEFENLVIARSLTKSFSIPGLRLGYSVTNGRLGRALDKLRAPWNLNCFAATVGTSVLTDCRELLEKSRGYIVAEIAWLQAHLEELGFSVYPSSTNFILFDTRGSGFTAAELVNRVLGHDVLLRNADSFYGLDGWHCRTAVRKREENEKLIAGLRRALG